MRELRERLDEKEEELAVRQAEHKRAVAKFRKENSALQLEFDKARNAAKQSRAKLAQVENELAICRKRLQLAKTRPGTPLDDSSNTSARRPASGQRSRRESGGGGVRSRSPAQNRTGSAGARANSGRKTRPQSAPIRGGSSGSESEHPPRGRYSRSPSPAQKRRGASPSLTRPTSADRRRREEVARREREREREIEKRNRFAGGANNRSQRASSAERRRAYSESLRERQGLSPAGAGRSRRRGGPESGSEAEQSDRSVGSRGSRGRQAGSQRKPPAKTKTAAPAAYDEGASMYSEDSVGNGGGKYDTGAEIADIDSRLNALQSFLRQAKQTSGGR